MKKQKSNVQKCSDKIDKLYVMLNKLIKLKHNVEQKIEHTFQQIRECQKIQADDEWKDFEREMSKWRADGKKLYDEIDAIMKEYAER